MPVIEGLSRKELGGLVDEGTYQVRIAKLDYVGVGDREGSQAKHPYLNGDLIITEDGEFLGRHVFQIFTLKKGSAFLLEQVCECLGMPEDWEINTDDLLEGELRAVIEIEPGKQGYSDRNRVKRFLPLE